MDKSKMYDLSSKFNDFYKSCVVLSQEEQTNLYEKKDINIERLKDGLEDYNEENGTSYSIVKTVVQGSVAMSTIVQNEEKEYDIDVAIVFDEDGLGGLGPRAARNMVADVLRRKAHQFKVEPEVKTSCVRIKYSENYHVDFAVYRRRHDGCSGEWIYEHSGSEWAERELEGLVDWFSKENEASDGKLRKIVRLSKMFCNSREAWKNMPSGLLQTVLCDEMLQSSYERIDEMFYYTMQEIVDRIENDKKVSAPVDNGRDLTPRKSDIQKMVNWGNRLKSKLEDLSVLFDDECTETDAIQAWYGFFNHDYWDKKESKEIRCTLSPVIKGSIIPFEETEEFIEDLYPVKINYKCEVSCEVRRDGWRTMNIREYCSRHICLPLNFEIHCKMTETSCPKPFAILWKVKNVGPEAERRNQLRGQIVNRGSSIIERTRFWGKHYIECYIIKDGTCVARRRIEVPIER